MEIMAFLVVPSVLVLGACTSYFAGSHYVQKNYPAPQPPKYKVGDEVTVKRRNLKRMKDKHLGRENL